MAGALVVLNPVSLTLCGATATRPDAGIGADTHVLEKLIQVQTVIDAEEALIKPKAL